MKFEDYHVHTHFSDDSNYLMEQVVQDALSMGMDEICFTDHVDYGIKKDRSELSEKELEKVADFVDDAIGLSPDAIVTNVDYPNYFKELNRLSDLYTDKIQIKKGLEFGIQSHTIEKYQSLFDTYKDQLDFIILSIHQVEDKEFWNQDYQKGKSQDEVYTGYYNELYKVIQIYKDYSVLGHLDLISRYDAQGNYPFEKVKPIVQKILKQVIEDGKGIELNTSSIRYGLKDSTPAKEILELYKNLGGKIITLGSDSHTPAHLGKYIQDYKNYLKELGFSHYYTFEKMQPTAHTL